MSLFKTFSYLLFLAFLFNSYAHNCIHDRVNVTLDVVEEPHQTKHFIRHAAADYRPIQMTIDFSNIASVKNHAKKYIRETLMAPVQSFWEAALKVIPKTSRITVASNACSGHVTIPANATSIGYSGDIVIFVSAVYDGEDNYLAYALPCSLDSATNRPIVGAIVFNTYYVSKDKKPVAVESDISTTLHEMTHVMGMSPYLYNKFINPLTLRPLTGHYFQMYVNDIYTKVLDLPPLTKRLRAHFNCPTLRGAYMENQGGSGSAGSHFERRIFGNEFMTADDIKDPRFSEFTLAFLEGTGWYQVNYTFAEPMTYGKNEGCAFLNSKCVSSYTKKASFKEFCSPLMSRGVSWTRRTFGYCGVPEGSRRRSTNLDDVLNYWGNYTVMMDPFGDNCPFIMPMDDYDCEDEKNVKDAILGNFESYGVGAHAFAGTLSRKASPEPILEGYCFKSKCLKKSSGSYSLSINFKGKGNVTCDAAGDLDPSSFPFNNTMTGKLQCPDPNDFCNQVESEGYCKGACYGNGDCINKECKCKPGWTSHNCAKREYIDNCPRCGSDPWKTTCFGNMCICKSSNITCQCQLGLKTGSRCNPNATNTTDDGSSIPDDNTDSTSIPDDSSSVPDENLFDGNATTDGSNDTGVPVEDEDTDRGNNFDGHIVDSGNKTDKGNTTDGNSSTGNTTDGNISPGNTTDGNINTGNTTKNNERPSTNPNYPNENDPKSGNGGMMLGICIAVAVIVIVIIAGVAMKKKKQSLESNHMADGVLYYRSENERSHESF